MKTCSKCGETKPNDEFYLRSRYRPGYWSSTCKVCERAAARAWHAAHPNRHRERAYGLTAQQYAEMLQEQESRCAICRSPLDAKICVDHCHATKAVRGLLCAGCNTGIGQLRDDPEILRAAITYLEANRDT